MRGAAKRSAGDCRERAAVGLPAPPARVRRTLVLTGSSGLTPNRFPRGRAGCSCDCYRVAKLPQRRSARGRWPPPSSPSRPSAEHPFADISSPYHWSCGRPRAEHGTRAIISAWARQREIDATLWTALPPKFEDQVGRAPESAKQVMEHLRSRDPDTLAKCREYVERAPVQVTTMFRAAIEEAMEWGTRDSAPA